MVWVKPSMRDEEDLVAVNIVDRHDALATRAPLQRPGTSILSTLCAPLLALGGFLSLIFH